MVDVVVAFAVVVVVEAEEEAEDEEEEEELVKETVDDLTGEKMVSSLSSINTVTTNKTNRVSNHYHVLSVLVWSSQTDQPLVTHLNLTFCIPESCSRSTRPHCFRTAHRCCWCWHFH